jgi:hypothetical protein
VFICGSILILQPTTGIGKGRSGTTDEHKWTQIRPALSYLSRKTIRSVFVVSNTLGVGFPEKVYENALVLELRNSGPAVESPHNVAGVVHGA